jgi:hypothetical protein
MVQHGTNRHGHLTMIINPWAKYMVQRFCWPRDYYFPQVFGSKLILKLVNCSYDYSLIRPGT